MRLGLNHGPVDGPDDLAAHLPTVDELGLGTVVAPSPGTLLDWSVAEAREYGRTVRDHGLTVGELGFWRNAWRDEEYVADARALLERADAMRAACVVSVLGSFAEGMGAPHPDNYGARARETAIDRVEAVLDGLALDHTRYAVEPWYNTFCHRPRAVRDFLDDVGDDRLGVHMDAMNMHTVETCYRSTEVIDRAFDLLGDDAVAVHCKDLAMVAGEGRDVVTLREVPPERGALDYDRYVERIADLDDDVPVYTEHWADESTYRTVLRRLRAVAGRNGVSVVERGGGRVVPDPEAEAEAAAAAGGDG